jgi:hypothetical protein
MTDLELIQSKLSELEKLEAAATPGVWLRDAGNCVITEWVDETHAAHIQISEHALSPQGRADAAFIAASRVAVPSLTAALKKAVEGLDYISNFVIHDESGGLKWIGAGAKDSAASTLSAVAAALGGGE